MIIFDLETTGLIKPYLTSIDKQPKIIEIAAIKLDDNSLEEKERLSFFVNPKEKLEKFIINLTKINDSMIFNQKDFNQRSEQIIDFFNNEKTLISHNLSFDKNVLDYELKRINKKLPSFKNLICTVTETRQIKGFRLKLQDLYYYLFNENFEDSHRAINDTLALSKCVKELITKNYLFIN